MIRRACLLVSVLCLLAMGGCSTPRPPLEQKPDLARGGHVFSRNCAACHMNPDNDAPQLDESGDWNMRTHEWKAVLQDHARNGFLKMPPKGGRAGISDQEIVDVIYFMEVKIRSLE